MEAAAARRQWTNDLLHEVDRLERLLRVLQHVDEAQG
jgi:hypothetical protein